MKLNENTRIFIQENVFENICETAAILSCVNWHLDNRGCSNTREATQRNMWQITQTYYTDIFFTETKPTPNKTLDIGQILILAEPRCLL